MAKSKKTRIDVAAGGLIEDISDGSLRIAIVKRFKYDDWSLPKGHLDRGESIEEAAIREVEEETGCKGEIISIIDPLSYLVRGQPKIVVYYRMALVERNPFKPDDEIAAVQWVTPDEAVEVMTYSIERDLVSRIYRDSTL